jgi:hypothetical protein
MKFLAMFFSHRLVGDDVNEPKFAIMSSCNQYSQGEGKD